MAYIFEQIRKKKFFFICLFFILVTGAIWLFIAGKAATFIALNGYHASWLNIFFINYTYLGDGIFAIIIVALCFFVLKKKAGRLGAVNCLFIIGPGSTNNKKYF